MSQTSRALPVRTRPESLRLATSQGTVPLGFAREAERVYLVARERSALWPIDVLRSGRARLLLAEGEREGAAELVTEPRERERVLDLFREKYGDELFGRWYAHPARVLLVDLARSSAGGPGTARYYGWLTSEFDGVADDYDRHITGNRINRLLRDRSLAQLRRLSQGRRRLLEVGCGSGMETLPLLVDGHEVVAVDISRRMLAVVERKARDAGVAERLTTVAGEARELESLLHDEPEGSFDGAYSTYGALNCEPDLRPIPPAFRRLLRAGAPLLLGIYNRWCLAELAGYGLTFQLPRALGRRANPIPVGASRFCVDVYAHTVADIAGLFHTGFRVERVEGVPVVLPPSDLTAYAEKFSRHFDRLARWDAWLGARWPWNRLGDHFLMTLRRS